MCKRKKLSGVDRERTGKDTADDEERERQVCSVKDEDSGDADTLFFIYQPKCKMTNRFTFL